MGGKGKQVVLIGGLCACIVLKGMDVVHSHFTSYGDGNTG